MSNISHVWDSARSRGDWQVAGGRMATGRLLESAVIISLFTDRVAQPDYRAPDGSDDRRGWWQDTFDGIPIGSRLWQLRRRKIADRAALALEARDMCQEALQWMVDAGIASAVEVQVSLPRAGVGSSGALLSFEIAVVQPTGTAPLVRALWQS